MRLIRSPRTFTRTMQALRRRGTTTGFIPTMGALHEGHASLIRAARRECGVVAVSIFVNRLQFGPREDYGRYPRMLAQDARLVRASGGGIVFAPETRQMYPHGFATRVSVERLSRRWEGASRPGHFPGVATIVAKLLCLAQPTTAYFGQKDYQQCLLVQRMVRDLDLPIAIRMLPTVRERDGLAMSSRNSYLSPAQRAQAPVLWQSLQLARQLIRAGERRAGRIEAALRRLIRVAPEARVDYIGIVRADTLEPLARLKGQVAILLAVRLGRTRLIDNCLVRVQ